jgi:hypothetical protein
MSLDFFLYIDSTQAASDVLRHLALAGNYHSNGRLLTKEGVTASGAEVGPITRDLVRDTFGFLPSVSIMFTIDKDNSSAARDLMITDVTTLLRQEPGDAVLIMAGDLPLLARQDGCVLLNDNFYNFWTTERRTRFPLPHALGALPMM